jgi:acyl-homoserine-lactone acylase
VGELAIAVVITIALLAGCTSGSKKATALGGSAVGSGPFQATIRRTTDGVPHIVAADWGGLSFGQGYASAEDRSCDLADQVIKIRGERAKWLGAGEKNANVDSDFSWKAIGVYDRAVADYPTKSPEIHQLVDAFAAGWDAYLAKVGTDGINGWCKGAAWVQPVTGLDVYAYARAITLQASSGQLLSYIAKAEPPATPAAGAAFPTATPAASAESATATAASATASAVSLGLGSRFDSSTAALGSNGWSFGKERTESGGGMLLANPHFPWEQELRFWEVQLTIPGQNDIYGVQLSGLPGVGIGFTDSFAWTHTVSAGNRFTAYTLDLVPGSPTTYTYDGAPRAMTSRPIAIDVKQPDGTTATTTRTAWSSHYGPVISFPGVGWTGTTTVTYRDANIDNDAFLDQYLAMDQAHNLDEFIAAHEKHQGVPLFNTIATSRDGRAWYADTSATPDLSPAAIAAYEDSLKTNLIASAAADSGAVVLDGSKSLNEWVDEPGARSPGLVPYARMPKVERSDYVFNANDSFWLPNADHPLAGDYSPLHGRQDTVRSLRTRENAVVLRDTSPTGPAGADGKFNLDELAAAALLDRGYSSRALKDDVVARCQGAGTVDVAVLPNDKPELGLPAGTIDLTKACATLAAWDGTYNLDARGAALWREFMGRFENKDIKSAGVLWATPFDAAQPVETPSGLAPAPTGAPDPVLVNLARAVQIFDRAGKPVDAPLGDLQFADRNGQRVPIHGGNSVDGTTNVVGYSSAPGSTIEPIPTRGPLLAARSSLTSDGYMINNGSSFMMVVDYGPDGPRAKVLLNYGDTQDRTNPVFVDSTRRFSDKNWRDVVLGEDAVVNQPGMQEETVSGPR